MLYTTAETEMREDLEYQLRRLMNDVSEKGKYPAIGYAWRLSGSKAGGMGAVRTDKNWSKTRTAELKKNLSRLTRRDAIVIEIEMTGGNHA